MKKNLILFTVLAIFASMSMQAKGSGEGKQFVTIVTGGTGGTYYPVGTIFSTLLNEKLGKVDNIQASAQTSGGSVENLKMLEGSEAQFGIAVAAIAYKAQTGTSSFKDKQYAGVRLVTGLWPEPNQFVVTVASKIKSVKDIAGKRFSVGAIGSGVELDTITILETLAGLKLGVDFKTEHLGYAESSAAMQNGQLDGANIEAGIPSSAVSELTAGKTPVRILNFSKKDAAKLAAVNPSFGRYKIAAGTYPNIDEDVYTVGPKSALITDASVSEDLVYKVVKTIYDNHASIVDSHAALIYVTLENAVSGMPALKLHPGAIKFYDEVGVKIPKGMR